MTVEVNKPTLRMESIPSRTVASSHQWMANFRDSYAIHNVTAMRSEFPLFLIRWDGSEELEWMELGDPRQRIKPFHFEIHFGKELFRDAYYLASLEEACQKDEVICKELFGFWDLFYCIDGASEVKTFLYAGQFCRDYPDWSYLAEQWKKLSGKDAASADSDFVQFVRMSLSLPVIEEPLLHAMKEFIQLYGSFLVGHGNMGVQDRIDELNRDFFTKYWPIEDWIDSVLSTNKFRVTPWYYEGKLTEWMKEGMGISRMPTRALAIMPLDSRRDCLDPVQTLVRNARIQRECISFVRTLPNTAATRLGDYGVSIITSTSKGNKNKACARLELRELAQKLQGFLHDKMKVRSVVGIGSAMPAGSQLSESHREAVLSLHMCIQLEKDVLFYDEHGEKSELRYVELQKSAEEVIAAFDRQNNTGIKLASDEYVQLVLRYANERIEVVRSQFLSLLFQLLSSVQRRYPMRPDVRDRFAQEVGNPLENANSLYAVIESFKMAMQLLNFVASRAWHGPEVMRIEATLQYLKENYVENLQLPEVAKRAGFSVAAFSRVFKKATGTSFLAFLRAIRVDQAKKLLITTPMTTEQIAQGCGFHSQHHLIRSFKKVTSQTPGAFRKSHASKHF